MSNRCTHIHSRACTSISQEAFRNNNGIDTPALQYTYIAGADAPPPPAVTEIYSVAGRPDGAEEDVATGAMYLTSSDYEVSLFPNEDARVSY